MIAFIEVNELCSGRKRSIQVSEIESFAYSRDDYGEPTTIIVLKSSNEVIAGESYICFKDRLEKINK